MINGINRLHICTALAVVLSALPVTFAGGQAATPPATRPDVVIADTLDRTLPTLRFNGVSLSDAVDFLRDISGANIFVDWKSLQAAGIDRDTPVTANVRNVKFSKALSLVLESVGGPGNAKLGYTIDDGVITISTRDDLARNVVVRVYDIRDLLIAIPDYSSSPEDAGPAPTTRPVTRDDRVEWVTKLIMDTVDAASWKDRGGQVGAMRELEGQLIVTQTPENHRQLVALLTAVRDGRSVQVSVEAKFINCEFQTIEKLIAEWNRSATPPAPVDSGKKSGAVPASGNKLAGVFLSRDQVNELLKIRQVSPQSMMITAPRLTVFSGQRAYVKVATSVAYLAGYIPTTKGDGEVRYEPVNKSVESGIAMDVAAVASDNRTAVTLTLRPKVTTFLGFNRVVWPGSPRPVELMVQDPRVKTSEIQTTVTVPDGSTVLLGGLEDPNSESKSDSPATRPSAPTRGLYLLVTPRIIGQEPTEQKPFPQMQPVFKHQQSP